MGEEVEGVDVVEEGGGGGGGGLGGFLFLREGKLVSWVLGGWVWS